MKEDVKDEPEWRGPLLGLLRARSGSAGSKSQLVLALDPDSGHGSSSTNSSTPSPRHHLEEHQQRPRANSNPFSMAALLAVKPTKPPSPPVYHQIEVTRPVLSQKSWLQLGFPPLSAYGSPLLPAGRPALLPTGGSHPDLLAPHASAFTCLRPVAAPTRAEAESTATETSAGAGAVSHHSSPTASSHSAGSPPGPIAPAVGPAPPNAACVVCEDKASGFHYSVISCEGCKGFFRRTVQKGMEYSCPKAGTCPVNRITRNRCQACRFAKCLSAGMTKESVRQDGNRKRKLRDEEEEAELRETARLQGLIRAVHAAHSAAYPPPPAEYAGAPLAAVLEQELAAGRGRVEGFSGGIPGFGSLPPGDQALLRRTALYEIALLWAAFHLSEEDLRRGVDISSQAWLCGVRSATLLETLLRLRDSFRHLQVYGEELALLSAVCLLPSTNLELRDCDAVEALQGPILEALRVQIALRRPRDPNACAKLLLKISDLRALSVKMLHSQPSV